MLGGALHEEHLVEGHAVAVGVGRQRQGEPLTPATRLPDRIAAERAGDLGVEPAADVPDQPGDGVGAGGRRGAELVLGGVVEHRVRGVADAAEQVEEEVSSGRHARDATGRSEAEGRGVLAGAAAQPEGQRGERAEAGRHGGTAEHPGHLHHGGALEGLGVGGVGQGGDQRRSTGAARWR